MYLFYFPINKNIHKNADAAKTSVFHCLFQENFDKCDGYSHLKYTTSSWQTNPVFFLTYFLNNPWLLYKWCKYVCQHDNYLYHSCWWTHTHTHSHFSQKWLKSFRVFGLFFKHLFMSGRRRGSGLIRPFLGSRLRVHRAALKSTWTNLPTGTSWPHSSGHEHFVSPVTALWVVKVMSSTDSGPLMLLLAPVRVATRRAVPRSVPIRNAHYF